MKVLPFVPSVAGLLLIVCLTVATAQPVNRLRNGSFEQDADGDGIPDGWYNSRGASLRAEPGRGNTLQLANDVPGRPAHLMQAFSLEVAPSRWLLLEAEVQLSLRWGRHRGETAGIDLHFLDSNYQSAGWRRVGAWAGETGWESLAIPVRVPAQATEAVLTLGTFGAVGQVSFDALRLTSLTVAPTNLLRNGDFRFGDPAPLSWVGRGTAARTTVDAKPALHLSRASSLAQGVYLGGREVTRLLLDFEARSAAKNDAATRVWLGFFPPSREHDAARAITVGDRWERQTLDIDVPPGATLAGVSFSTPARGAPLLLRAVRLRGFDAQRRAVVSDLGAAPNAEGWSDYAAAAQIEPGSPLDAGALLDAPAGKHGLVTVEGGHLEFADGTPARFFGVELRAPAAFPEADQASAVAARLAAAGFNLVRFAGLDDPAAWNENLLDPESEQSTALSDLSLDSLDRLCAELRSHGIYYAFELCSRRVPRPGDELAGGRQWLPGFPLAQFLSPAARRLQTETSLALLNHHNPHVGLRYLDDPALAFVNLSAGGSLLSLAFENALRSLPPSLVQPLEADWNHWLAQRNADRAALEARWQADGPDRLAEAEDPAASTVRLPAATAAQPTTRLLDFRTFCREQMTRVFLTQAEALRKAGLSVPIGATASPAASLGELAARAAADLVFTSAHWTPNEPVTEPKELAVVRDVDHHPAVSLAAGAVAGKPVVALAPTLAGNEWGNPFGWQQPLWLSAVACRQGWDAVVCGQLARAPTAWGQHAPGGSPDDDRQPVPEALNGHPSLVAQLPVAARLFLGGGLSVSPQRITRTVTPDQLNSNAAPTHGLPSALPFTARLRTVLPGIAAQPLLSEEDRGSLQWEPTPGAYSLRSERQAGVAGFVGGRRFDLGAVHLQPTTECCALFVESLTSTPLALSPRILVTAVAHAAQSGMTYTDGRRLGVLDFGRPPMKVEPVTATLTLDSTLPVTQWNAYALDPAGRRGAAVPLSRGGHSVRLSLPTAPVSQHVELTAAPASQ